MKPTPHGDSNKPAVLPTLSQALLQEKARIINDLSSYADTSTVIKERPTSLKDALLAFLDEAIEIVNGYMVEEASFEYYKSLRADGETSP
jgi:hypothetical protein